MFGASWPVAFYIFLEGLQSPIRVERLNHGWTTDLVVVDIGGTLHPKFMKCNTIMGPTELLCTERLHDACGHAIGSILSVIAGRICSIREACFGPILGISDVG